MTWIELEGSIFGLDGYTVLYDVSTGTIVAQNRQTGAADYLYQEGNPENNWPGEVPGQSASFDDRMNFAIDATNASIAYSQAQLEGETPGGYETIGGEAYSPSSISEETRERQERTRGFGEQAAAWIGWPGGTTTAAPVAAPVAQPAAGLPAPLSNAIGAGASTEGWMMSQPDASGTYTIISPDQTSAFQIGAGNQIVGRWYKGREDVSTFDPFATATPPAAPAPSQAAPAPPVKREPIVQGPTKSQQIRAETISRYYNPAIGGYGVGDRPQRTAEQMQRDRSRYNAFLRRRGIASGSNMTWTPGATWVPDKGFVTGPGGTSPAAVTPTPVEEAATPAAATTEPTAPWLENLRTGRVAREWEPPTPGTPRFPTAQQWYAMSESEKEGLKGSVESNAGYWPDYYDWMIRSWVPGTETRLRPKWGW